MNNFPKSTDILNKKSIDSIEDLRSIISELQVYAPTSIQEALSMQLTILKEFDSPIISDTILDTLLSKLYKSLKYATSEYEKDAIREQFELMTQRLVLFLEAKSQYLLKHNDQALVMALIETGNELSQILKNTTTTMFRLTLASLQMAGAVVDSSINMVQTGIIGAHSTVAQGLTATTHLVNSGLGIIGQVAQSAIMVGGETISHTIDNVSQLVNSGLGVTGQAVQSGIMVGGELMSQAIDNASQIANTGLGVYGNFENPNANQQAILENVVENGSKHLDTNAQVHAQSLHDTYSKINEQSAIENVVGNGGKHLDTNAQVHAQSLQDTYSKLPNIDSALKDGREQLFTLSKQQLEFNKITQEKMVDNYNRLPANFISAQIDQIRRGIEDATIDNLLLPHKCSKIALFHDWWHRAEINERTKSNFLQSMTLFIESIAKHEHIIGSSIIISGLLHKYIPIVYEAKHQQYTQQYTQSKRKINTIHIIFGIFTVSALIVGLIVAAFRMIWYNGHQIEANGWFGIHMLYVLGVIIVIAVGWILFAQLNPKKRKYRHDIRNLDTQFEKYKAIEQKMSEVHL